MENCTTCWRKNVPELVKCLVGPQEQWDLIFGSGPYDEVLKIKSKTADGFILAKFSVPLIKMVKVMNADERRIWIGMFKTSIGFEKNSQDIEIVIKKNVKQQ